MNKIAFVFPGQGSQKVGMGQDVAAEYKEAKAVYKAADAKLGYAITEVIEKGPMELLTKSENAQPALVSTSVAILKALETYGVKADFVAGHSLGEYSALVAGGFLSAEDAIYLVHRRGKLMEAAVPNGQGAMAAVLGLDREALSAITEAVTAEGDDVQLANLNCPGQIVISGTIAGVEKAGEQAKVAGAKRVLPLAVSGPFHSKLMVPAAEQFQSELDKVAFQDGAIPVVNNVDAQPTTDKNVIPEKLVQQIYSPVLWEDIVMNLIAQGVDTFVEIGSGKVLSGLIKKINRDVTILAAGDVSSVKEVAAQLKGAPTK
ncbi:ACP S-malonyltransferase [Paenilisteria rocourtiae]|uniref:Malonyl CoA-acyl carrier protein transacylase n=1 Tax=Listeria rocourtiae TaxID=647910 RepID=A0A4R6ZR93_9LIST|nr:ACP S-malonyltransferase [Listeria rocourtiae]EUJ49301.1 malonyl CoA-acyl carrier protein transacylase [Listeria rocourtiae FSL F6-920]MBC1603534.1 ACP S-malonyltransferase [Listeria rocourtiae]TDR55181.1 [acyl-carrier-protein] S-malonyltransferase [Listeria rocourtiae]